MTPGIVGDQREFPILCLEFALLAEVQCLGVGDKRRDGGSGNLALAQGELRFLVDEGLCSKNTHD